MKKILATIVLFFSLVTSSLAFAPLVIPAIAIGAGALVSAGITLGLARGLYPYMKSGSSSTVSVGGDISRPSAVAWVDLTMETPAVQTKDISANMPWSQASTIGRKTVDGTADGMKKYPLIDAKLFREVPPGDMTIFTPLGVVSNTHLGTRVATGGATQYSTMVAGSSTTDAENMFGPPPAGKVYIVGPSSGNTAIYVRSVRMPLPTDSWPSPRLVNPETFADDIVTGAATSGVVDNAYQAEIDKMFQDPDYVPSFSDSTTGLPYSPPPSSSVATPEEVASYNASGAAGAVATETATAALGSASGSVTAAQGAVNAAQGALSADPSNAGLQIQLATAQKGLADAQAALDKLKAEQAADVSADLNNDSIKAPSVGEAYGDGSKKNFGTRMSAFMSDMKSSSLFSMPGQILGNIPTGGESTFNLNFGRFGTTTFDLASFGTSINLIKTLVLIIFSITGFRIVALKGGSG